MPQECIFCRISGGQVKSEMLYRDQDCFVIKDIAPKAPLHLLIIPHQHFTYLTGLTADFYPVLGAMFAAARGAAQHEGVVKTGYRLIINQGNDAGQQVPHLHLHLMAGRPLGPMG